MFVSWRERRVALETRFCIFLPAKKVNFLKKIHYKWLVKNNGRKEREKVNGNLRNDYVSLISVQYNEKRFHLLKLEQRFISSFSICVWNWTHIFDINDKNQSKRFIFSHIFLLHVLITTFICTNFIIFFKSDPISFHVWPSKVSKAKILGNPELFIKSGNDINLTCITSQVSSPPSFIYWFKGERVVNYSQRGGINVTTDRTTKTSNLIISRAAPADSGNYTCAPSNSGKLIN